MDLNLPQFQPRIRRSESGRASIYDPIRRRYVALTPEEFVRQAFVAFLTGEKGYPAGLLANEIQIELNGTKKRCDSVVFDRRGEPLMIIEYKAPTIALTPAVFDQVLRYNAVLRARYFIMSNGLKHICFDMSERRFLREIPDFSELLVV